MELKEVKEVKPTVLYKGIFNYHGEVHIIYRRGGSERQAFILMCRGLARSLGVIGAVTYNYFYETARYQIEEVQGR